MSIVNVQKDRYTVEPLYQWDVNQVLEIRGLSLPSVPSIHFSNEAMDRAIVRVANMDGAGVITVDIPNSLLQKPYKIKAYVCIYEGETFETLYKIEIPINARKKPADYTIEDDQEIYSFNELENMVYSAVRDLTINHDETLDKVEAVCEDLNNKVYNASNELEALQDNVTKLQDNVNDLTETSITMLQKNKLCVITVTTSFDITDHCTGFAYPSGFNIDNCMVVGIMYKTDDEPWSTYTPYYNNLINDVSTIYLNATVQFVKDGIRIYMGSIDPDVTHTIKLRVALLKLDLE